MTSVLIARHEALLVKAKSYLQQAFVGGAIASVSAIHLTSTINTLISTNPMEALIAKSAIQTGEALVISSPGIAKLIFSATTAFLVSLKILTVLAITLAVVYVGSKLQSVAIDMGYNWVGVKMGVFAGYAIPIFLGNAALPVIGFSFIFGSTIVVISELFSRLISQGPKTSFWG